MSFYQSIISSISQVIGKGQEEQRQEIIIYGVEVFVSILFTFLVLVLTGYILGVLKTTLVIACICPILRSFTGGAHSKSIIGCTLITVIIFPLLALAAENIILPLNYVIILIITVSIFSFIVFYKLAPVDCEEKPIVSNMQRQRLKKISLSLSIILLIIQLTLIKIYPQYSYIYLAVSFAILWQALQLTFIGQAIAVFVDWGLNLGKKGG